MKKMTLFRMLMCVSVAIFVLSSGYIFKYYYNIYRSEQLIQELQEKVDEIEQETETQIELEAETETEGIIEEEKVILPEYEALYEENSDLFGWIKIEGTVIDYPVMYTPDDYNFYLYKDWNKEDSSSGSIFVDGRSDENTEN